MPASTLFDCPRGASVSTAALLSLRALAPNIRARKPRVASHMAGQYLSRSRGRGLEFAEVRHYQQGDDIRAIDWRVTARSGKPHTRLYIEEREKPVLIFCDQRHSMQFGSRQRFKSVQAANIAALIAWGALAAGDRVGGIIASGARHIEVRPSLSAKTVAHFLHLLATQNQAQNHQDTVPLEQLIGEIQRLSKPGSSIYIVSDCHDWHGACDQQLALISRHCNVTIIHVNDPLEYQLPKHGAYPFTDGQRRVVLAGANHAQQLADRFAQKQQQLAATCQRYRAGFWSARTDADAVAIAHDCLRGQYAQR